MGARLNDTVSWKERVVSFTACLRFNIKILGTVENGKRGQIMSMVTDLKSTALPDFRNLLDLWAIYPASILAFGHPQTNTTYSTYILQDSQAYIGLWQILTKIPRKKLDFFSQNLLPLHNVCTFQGYDVFPPDTWHHFCVSFNTETNKIRFTLVI